MGVKTFLHSMKEKKPNFILTNEDEAMCMTLGKVMSQAKHRLWSRNISRNANTNLKSEQKLKAFNRCMKKFQSADQFEEIWQEMLDEFNLQIVKSMQRNH